MILTTHVDAVWNPTTKEHYEELGYTYTGHGENFKVPVAHLMNSSNVLVMIQCDYCNTKTNRMYSDYNDSLEKCFVKKDACKKCTQKKNHENLIYRQNNNTLTLEDKGYLTFRENRLKELNKYIKKHKTVAKMTENKTGNKIYHSIHKYGDNINDMITELGYDIFDVRGSTPTGYYNDINKVKDKITTFIKENKRFPLKEEIINNLKIGQRYIDRFGGVYELKRIMNYFDGDDLVDDRLFINESSLEFIVAQFLIFHDIKYKRDRLIDPHGNRRYRYDFHLTDYDLYIEVWGFQGSSSDMTKNYQETRLKKEHLYKELNFNLVSIEQGDLSIHDTNTCIEFLCGLFKGTFEILSDIPSNIFVSSKTISDEVILSEIMEHSSKGHILPSQNILRENGKGHLTRIIRKRHGSYYNFAKRFDCEIMGTKISREDMNKELVYEKLEYIVINLNRDISKKSLKKIKLGNPVGDWIKRNGGMIEVKLAFFEYLSKKEDIILPKKSIKFLYNISKGKSMAGVNNIPSRNQQELSIKILDIVMLANEKNKEDYNDIKKFYESQTPRENQEYIDNFLKVVDMPYKLTPRGFDESSPISSFSYHSYYQLYWIKIVQNMGKFEEYDGYLIGEYRLYLLENKDDYKLERFIESHPYIKSTQLMMYRNREDWLTVTGVKVNKKRYNDEDFKINFNRVKDEVNQIPLYNDFNELSDISINTYVTRFNLRGRVYDRIVKMYCTKDEYKSYLERKQEHKSSVGSITGSLSRKYTKEDLKDNFLNVIKEYGDIPPKRVFSKFSKIDESTYRKRLGMKWQEVKDYYSQFI